MRIDQKGKNNCNAGTMACQSAFPDHEDLLRMCKVIGRFIEQAMAKSCTHNCSQDHICSKLVNVFDRNVLLIENPGKDQITE